MSKYAGCKINVIGGAQQTGGSETNIMRYFMLAMMK